MTRLSVDWSLNASSDFDEVLKRFEHDLEEKGLRRSTIEGYVGNAKRYLRFAHGERPTAQDAEDFLQSLRKRGASCSTLNQYAYAIKAYHAMHGEHVAFKRLNPDNHIPFFFDTTDIVAIFSACRNLKHLAMLHVLFYGALRASELCNLDISDLDFRSGTIRIRDGKGGKEAIALISGECIKVLQNYIKIRLRISDTGPLFITDYGRRWSRGCVHEMFIKYKKKANVNKCGGVHVFARHSVGALLVQNGCDIAVIKEIMRHEDISTTARYLHLSNETKREKYTKFMKL